MLTNTTPRRIALTLAALALSTSEVTFAGPGYLGAQYLEQQTGFIPDTSELGDAFGAAVARGDFNCDGYQDLAIGVPEEDLLGGLTNAGQVTVVFGSETGLDPTTSIFLSQSLGLLAGSPAGVDFRFGASLAAGNFDGNAYLGRSCDDLAIGVPGMSYSLGGSSTVQGGGVIILPSLANGNGFWYVASRLLVSSSISGIGHDGDAFGFAIAAGDFNLDGFDDLAIGSPGEDIGGQADAGRLRVISGTEFGLSPSDSPILQVWSQSNFGAAIEAGDSFGSVLAVGDYNRGDASTFDDLIVGIPDEDVGALEDAGAILAIYGTPLGLTDSGSQIITQNDAFIGIDAAPFNRFGASLATADFDGNTADDIAVGSPGADQTVSGGGFEITYNDVGVVHVIYGEPGDELRNFGDVIVRRSDWFGSFGGGDEFGFAVAAADFDLDGLADLAIAGPGANPGAVAGAGVVHILTGAADAAKFDAGATLFQNSAELGTAESGDEFGWSLVAADFDGDGTPDLAVGVPFEETANGAAAAGAVNVFYSSELFSDGFESGDLSGWSTFVN